MRIAPRESTGKADVFGAVRTISVVKVDASCEQLAGVLIGTGVGDSLGLVRENLSAHRGKALYGSGPLRQRFLLGRWGVFSDDTEHAYVTVRAYVQASDVDDFQTKLAAELAAWVRCFPGGAGVATLRACVRLAVGVPPGRAGVDSAGNGPVMRAAVLGAMAGKDDEVLLRPLCAVSTRLTHTDPRAERAAFIVAVAAARICHSNGPVDPAEFVNWLAEFAAREGDIELVSIVEHMKQGLDAGATVEEFTGLLGYSAGVPGYAYASTPVAVYAWLVLQRHPAAAVEAVIDVGGDTDSTAAVVGALCGAGSPSGCWPAGWVERIVDRPLSVDVLNQTAVAAVNVGGVGRSVFGWRYFLRNVGFAGWVVVLVIRRRFFGFVHRRNRV